jgi:hypothetical protein
MRPYILAQEFRNNTCVGYERLSPADAIAQGPRPSVEYSSPDHEHDLVMLLDFNQLCMVVERMSAA